MNTHNHDSIFENFEFKKKDAEMINNLHYTPKHVSWLNIEKLN